MSDAESDISSDYGESDDSIESDELSTEVLLLEYEQSRITIRQYITQQGRVFTSGIAAIAAISGYSVTISDSGYFSPIITTIPFIITAMSILSVEAENNNTVVRKHNERVVERLGDITGEEAFSIQQTANDIREANSFDEFWGKVPFLDASKFTLRLYNVPFLLLWSTAFAYFIFHMFVVPLSMLPWVPIGPILQSQSLTGAIFFAHVIAFILMCIALYSQLRLRQSEISS